MGKKLSLESTNPIQNRAVAEALANLPSGGANLLAQQVSLSGMIVNANANVSGNINVTLQGYTPIAAGQIRFSNTALSINSFYIIRSNNTDTLLFSARTFHVLLEMLFLAYQPQSDILRPV